MFGQRLSCKGRTGTTLYNNKLALKKSEHKLPGWEPPSRGRLPLFFIMETLAAKSPQLHAQPTHGKGKHRRAPRVTKVQKFTDAFTFTAVLRALGCGGHYRVLIKMLMLNSL